MSKSLRSGMAAVVLLCVCAAACDRPVKLASVTPLPPDTPAAIQPAQPAEVIPETDAAVWPENLPSLHGPYALQNNFQWFSGRAKVHYEGKDQSQDFNASIRIQKDQKIWLSINALGLLEVFRAVLTPESLQAVNRLEKVYYDFPLSEASHLLPVAADFPTVQNLLTAGVLGRRGSVLQMTPVNGQVSVLIQRPDMQQTLVLAGPDSTLREQSVYNQQAGLRIGINYEQYKAVGSRAFPYTQTIRVAAPDNNVALQLNYDKVSFDEAVEMPFSVPKKYKKAKLQ